MTYHSGELQAIDGFAVGADTGHWARAVDA